MLSLASTPSPLWYATRAGGTISLLLLTCTVALGVGTGSRYTPARTARFETGALHRNLSLLTLVFLALHVATAVCDTFVHLGLPALLVPFLSSYRPLWVGLGTVALDLLTAVALTSAVRLRIGRRAWKTVHMAAYAAWPVAVFHALGTGTDTRSPLQLVVYGVCIAVMAAAVGHRLRRTGRGPRPVWLVAASCAVALSVLLMVFAVTGPLRPGWAHRAQSPPPAAAHLASAPTEGGAPR